MVKIIHDVEVIFCYGLSTDTKPSGQGLNGSMFYEMDTKKTYIYDEENNIWREM